MVMVTLYYGNAVNEMLMKYLWFFFGSEFLVVCEVGVFPGNAMQTAPQSPNYRFRIGTVIDTPYHTMPVYSY